MKRAPKSAIKVAVLENSIPISSETEAIQERIRQRAFERSHIRPPDAHSLYDWLMAESEVISVPPAELIEKSGAFELNLLCRSKSREHSRDGGAESYRAQVGIRSSARSQNRDSAFVRFQVGDGIQIRSFAKADRCEKRQGAFPRRPGHRDRRRRRHAASASQAHDSCSQSGGGSEESLRLFWTGLVFSNETLWSSGSSFARRPRARMAGGSDVEAGHSDRRSDRAQYGDRSCWPDSATHSGFRPSARSWEWTGILPASRRR